MLKKSTKLKQLRPSVAETLALEGTGRMYDIHSRFPNSCPLNIICSWCSVPLTSSFCDYNKYLPLKSKLPIIAIVQLIIIELIIKSA